VISSVVSPGGGKNMEALGLIEITGLASAMVALDALEKSSSVRVLQVELNDQLGALLKVAGPAADVRAAVDVAVDLARAMRVNVVSDVINAPDRLTREAVESGPEFNQMLGSDVTFIPNARTRGPRTAGKEKQNLSDNQRFALGLIETQGLTAVLEALDTAAKAANVEVVGREKLGGGYVTIIIRGDVAAVQAAVDAGKAKVAGLGKLIAAHVIPRPSDALLSILPQS
jgi:carbon dioxide concentrating mechanism protein CcmO